jgi:hypothetical protein
LSFESWKCSAASSYFLFHSIFMSWNLIINRSLRFVWTIWSVWSIWQSWRVWMYWIVWFVMDTTRIETLLRIDSFIDFPVNFCDSQ